MSGLDIDQVPVQDLTPEQASHIIHSHRKRKVKCDNKQPCENCVKREHPQLCSYKPNRSSASKGSISTGNSTQGKKRPHSPDGQDETDIPTDHQPEGWRRAIEDGESAELSRYVGQNSIPALLRDQPSPIETKDGIDIRRDMRPILGLDNSAPFPLMSSKHLDRLTQDIFTELPPDREVMILFTAYKEIAHPFWGFVVDIDDLESRIMIYLEERAKNGKVLAVGSQYRDSPYHSRTRDSQRYVQISFHFLRLGNFLLRPNLDSIQALLLTGFVLLNDMKAEASWALIGMTCRLAQSLGLHRALASEDDGSREIPLKVFVRRKLWLNPDATADCTYDMILDNCNAIESLRERVYPQLRSKEALCCRPALRRDCVKLNDAEKATLADKCKANLTETVRMFLSMHQLSFIPTRSWAFTYHGLSSAVLLGILCETKLDPEVRQLQGDLISALSAAAATELTSPSPDHIRKSDKDIELSGPLSRALAALRNIYEYGSLHGASGLKSESASGTRTPIGAIIPQHIQNLNSQRLQPGFDRHQDAALAMAELQNGNTLPDFSSGMVYPGTMQSQVGIPDLSQIDPNSLAPMDLYDSIFWESPDPFYTGADMNFDFIPQAPPGQSQQQFYF
ncbi:fungal-specific transcription factor domain-containing protein [Xylariomycetidae sp. FL2044]|nr:fungal-specific transcription factor domain-containing protein [Xylariomycetidae sp. FL2044]